ncbi:sulfite exporter TauE/SafE family protein [Consotaella aegiceratis]|uniref:sulfite exporter TauE/SafE family protein n=1 Tax=Consotaella aegiceratis TaxID=3097961 RepID=UPI002F41AAA6
MGSFLLFLLVGGLAQLVDGALGMAYGVVSSTVLLSFGVPPAQASASVHAAELFTTAASGGSHLFHRNVDWRLFWRLAPLGIAGGMVGTYVLTSIDGAAVKPYVAAYLTVIGIYLVVRSFRRIPQKPVTGPVVPALAAAGGFLDAVGGGGWGPIVTSGLLGAGGQPRYVVGTVNTAEFLLTVAVSASFVVALLTGHWQEADGLLSHLVPVAGLIVGGVVAAPFAGYIVRVAPEKLLLRAVGLLICVLAATQIYQILGNA